MKTKIIILAAGKGTRMGSELPKALVPLNGKPMISYLAESVAAAGLDKKPIVIVSPVNKEIIRQTLSNYNWDYAVQTEQLGTGHAVVCARDLITDDVDNIIVLYCDHPFITASSINSFGMIPTEAVMIMPTKLVDFQDWRQNFYHWGRIIRNGEGNVEKIVEFKDATADEIEVTEVNPGFMCFNKNWLFANIDKLHDDNRAHEFYLTDMVKIAFEQGYTVGTLAIEPYEAMGINSKDELEIAENINVNRMETAFSL